jgi:putative MATE family efflux protein
MEDEAAAAGTTTLEAIPGRSIARQVVWLGTPVLVEQSLLYLVGISDTVLTGRFFSDDDLAAVTVSTYLLWFLASLFTIVSVGATALVARLCGANDRPEAARIAQQAITLALLFGTALLAAGCAAAPWLVRVLNLTGSSAGSATRFLRIVLSVTPLLACTSAGIASLRGAGDTRTGMWVMIAVNAINVAVGWTLALGLGPFPALGFMGIAVGTATAEGVGGLAILTILTRGRSGLRLELRGMVPAWSRIRRIVRISLPAAGESLTNTLCQLWFLSVINLLGPIATAAHGVTLKCESIAYLTVAAFSVPASTLTGQYLGAGRPDQAARAARTAWGMGALVLGLLGLFLYAQAVSMFAVFLGQRKPEVAALGVPVLRVVAFALPALATINILGGALRGAGDTRWPWLIVLFGYLAVRLPLTHLLAIPAGSGGLGWGLYGAWIAMFADLYVRGTLIALRFLHGGWKQARV